MADKMAIGLSAICTIHCLAFPIIIVSLPSLSALGLDGEVFHLWMLAAVIPISIYALAIGFQKHKRYVLLLMGSLGISLMILAVTLGEALLGESGEKIFTVLGATIVAIGHFWNYRWCQQHDNCECHV